MEGQGSKIFCIWNGRQNKLVCCSEIGPGRSCASEGTERLLSCVWKMEQAKLLCVSQMKRWRLSFVSDFQRQKSFCAANFDGITQGVADDTLEVVSQLKIKLCLLGISVTWIYRGEQDFRSEGNHTLQSGPDCGQVGRNTVTTIKEKRGRVEKKTIDDSHKILVQRLLEDD